MLMSRVATGQALSSRLLALKRDGKKPLYLDLAEYFALRVSGKWQKFNKSERAVWRLRLLVELDLVDLPDLGMVVPDAPTARSGRGSQESSSCLPADGFYGRESLPCWHGASSHPGQRDHGARGPASSRLRTRLRAAVHPPPRSGKSWRQAREPLRAGSGDVNPACSKCGRTTRGKPRGRRGREPIDYLCDSCQRPSPGSGRDFTQCTVCGEYFSGTTMFDRHRVGEHAHLFSPEHPEGRRCLSRDEMSSRGWELHPSKGWQDPKQVLRGRQRRTLFATSPSRQQLR